MATISRAGHGLTKVEQVAKHRLFFALFVVIIVIVVAAIITALIFIVVMVALRLHVGIGALDEFIELATVKPDATAVGAIINFDAISGRKSKLSLVNWA